MPDPTEPRVTWKWGEGFRGNLPIEQAAALARGRIRKSNKAGRMGTARDLSIGMGWDWEMCQKLGGKPLNPKGA